MEKKRAENAKELFNDLVKGATKITACKAHVEEGCFKSDYRVIIEPTEKSDTFFYMKEAADVARAFNAGSWISYGLNRRNEMTIQVHLY